MAAPATLNGNMDDHCSNAGPFLCDGRDLAEVYEYISSFFPFFLTLIWSWTWRAKPFGECQHKAALKNIHS